MNGRSKPLVQQQSRDRMKLTDDLDPKTSSAFGVDDNLELQLPAQKTINIAASSFSMTQQLNDQMQHLNDQLRGLKDEKGRLHKLVNEKDFEIRQLKKRGEEERLAFGNSGVVGDTAASKIVELSKKVRELTADVESEKSKRRYLARKYEELQIQASSKTLDGEARSKLFTDDEKSGEKLVEELKSTQEKLKQTESKMAEYRNQTQMLKNEMKMAHKVLTQEVGEGVNIQSLLSGNGNWRGRSQQLLVLQQKVTDLKAQLETLQAGSRKQVDDEVVGHASIKSKTDVKHKEQIKKLERERKDAQDRAAAELKMLEEEHTLLKQKMDANKARNKVLSGEVKSLKQQMKILLEKGQHDDELIAALMQQQTYVKHLLDNTRRTQQESSQQQQQQFRELNKKTQQDMNIVEQLKQIIAERETQVKRLEKEISQWKREHGQKVQMQRINAMFMSAEGEECTSQPSCPPAEDDPESNMDREYFQFELSPPGSRAGESKDLSRNSSRPTVVSADVDRHQVEAAQNLCDQLKITVRVAEVERDKLRELVVSLQKRLNDSEEKSRSQQNELIQQRRRNAELEKQIARAHLNKKGGVSSRRGGEKQSGSMLNSPEFSDKGNTDIFSINELQTQLEIQKDENEALKVALESTLKFKDEDFRIFTETIEQTKEVFLKALHQAQ